jgi:hypothetical protein
VTTTVDALGENVGALGSWKDTTGCWVSTTLSVVSVAVIVTDSAVESVTVNVATPDELVTWGFVVETAAFPEADWTARETVLPTSGVVPFPASNVTVTPVPTVVSAGDGFATTVDAEGDTARGSPNSTDAVEVNTTESVVSVAL